MLQYDVPLTCVGVAVAGANLLALRSIARRRSEESQRLLQQRGKLTGVAMNGLQTIETLKATGARRRTSSPAGPAIRPTGERRAAPGRVDGQARRVLDRS